MHLINTSTYKLEYHIKPEPYAILSHTWRDEEVLYAEFKAGGYQHKRGYRKIEYLCTQAQKDGHGYAWIDTACIDKESSAELSEAINSMFEWYREAKVCYVYIDDAETVDDIETSRWITRGWTLQELIAPYNVIFYSKDWTQLGTKHSLLSLLVRTTGIDALVLLEPLFIDQISAATRMSWAASRHTTRVEDMAYCLLGIFRVNMPLIYGEKDRAFRRLQQEILKQSHDISILAFDRTNKYHTRSTLLASSPQMFVSRQRIISDRGAAHCEVTSRGLEVTLPLIPRTDDKFWAVLPFRFECEHDTRLALSVYRGFGESVMDIAPSQHQKFGEDMWKLKSLSAPVKLIGKLDWAGAFSRKVLIIDDPPPSNDESLAIGRVTRHICYIEAHSLTSHGYEIIYAEPRGCIGSWNAGTMTTEVIAIEMVMLIKFAFVHRSHKEAFIVTLIISPNKRVYKRKLETNAKPADIDIDSWLTAEGMCGNVTEAPFTTSDSSQELAVDVGDDPWDHLDDLPLENGVLRLLSGTCMQAVKLKLVSLMHSFYSTQIVKLSIKPYKDGSWGLNPNKYHAADNLGEFEILDLECRASTLSSSHISIEAKDHDDGGDQSQNVDRRWWRWR